MNIGNTFVICFAQCKKKAFMNITFNVFTCVTKKKERKNTI